MNDILFETCTNCPHNRGEKPEYHEFKRGRERCIEVCPEAKNSMAKMKLLQRVADLEAELAQLGA